MPGIRHFFSAIVAAIEAAAIALVSFSVIAAALVLMWLLPFEMQQEPGAVLRATAAIWGLTHGVPLELQLSDGYLAYVAATEDLGFTLTLIPLGLSFVTIFLAVKLAQRASRTDGFAPLVLLSPTLSFAAFAGFILWLQAGFETLPEPGQVLTATLFFAVPLWLTLLVTHFSKIIDAGKLRGSLRMGAHFLPRIIRLSVLQVLTLVILGAVALTVAIVLGYPEAMQINQVLQLDLLGAIILFVAQLAYLPTLILWAIAWLSGSGFLVGEVTSVTPFEVLLGPLPSIPVLGFIPVALGEWGFAPIVFIFVGLATLVFFFMKKPEYAEPKIRSTLLSLSSASALSTLFFVLLGFLASGSIGPGRLVTVGVETLSFVAFLGLEILVASLFGFLLRKLVKHSELPVRNEADIETQIETEIIDLYEEESELVSSDNAINVKTEDVDTAEIPRIADPRNENDKPWFHRSMHKSAPVTPGLTEEELVQEYSWEALTEERTNENGVS